MISVFDYTDYRKYLEDYYEAKKKDNPNYSYQVMAEKAGFNNRGFVFNIVKGNKNLSKSNCFRISQALGHNKYEADYLENLVAFNKARSLKERNYFFEKISQMKDRRTGYTEAQVIRQEQYDFYSKWYHSAVRSIIDMYGFKGDYQWLAKMLTPSITAKQARDSVKLLLKLGIICKQSNGAYTITDKSITTGQEIVGLAIANFHIACTDLAKKAIHDLPRDQRNATGLTLGISRKAYERICEETLEFQKKIMAIADSDENADQVYQYNFHLFPISEN